LFFSGMEAHTGMTDVASAADQSVIYSSTGMPNAGLPSALQHAHRAVIWAMVFNFSVAALKWPLV
jgi:hypothetical protein